MSSSPEPNGRFHTDLAHPILGLREINFFFKEMKGYPFLKLEILIFCDYFNNVLLQS